MKGRIRCVVFAAGLICLASSVFAAAPATRPDERVKPGKSFFLEFPNLPQNRQKALSRMQVRIPDEYDPSKSFPLIAWMAGGEGGDGIGSAMQLGDPKKFVMVGLPYPLGCNNARQANMVGDFPKIWAYHKAMLDELFRVVPNISPHLRIISGFSNGAHCIDGELSVPRSGYLDYFTTFILADGGVCAGDYRQAAGKHLFIVWGEKSPNKTKATALAAMAQAAGLKVVADEMKNTGHAFPKEYVDAAHKWLHDVVTAQLRTQGLALLQSQVGSRRYEGAYALAQFLAVTSDDAGGDAKLSKCVEQLEAASKADWDKQKPADVERLTPLARRDLLARLEKFEAKWAGTPAAVECHEVVAKLRGQ